MRVIWAYSDLEGNRKSPLHTNPLEFYLLVVSVCSWIHFCGSATRVFYVDRSIYELLEEKKILHLWDKIEIVDFKKDLFDRFHVSFSAYPKIWAMTRQEEPFWISDTDSTIMYSITSHWFDKTQIWCKRYSENYQGNSVEDILRKQTEVKELKLKLPAGDLWDEQNCHHGGLLYFPDPKLAKVLGYSIFGAFQDLVGENIREGEKTFHRFEEGILMTILESCKSTIKVSEFPDGFYNHVEVDKDYSLSSEKCSKLNKYFLEKLGTDFRSTYRNTFKQGEGEVV